MTDQQNYFNYFTEIEDEFVRRRGRHILISPLDWSLIETWKTRGVPLDVVLRGINTSFDSFDKALRRTRKVNSLLYCQQEVEASYEEYCAARVGAPPLAETQSGISESSLSPEAIVSYLKEQRMELNSLKTMHLTSPLPVEGLGRSIERLDRILETIDKTGLVQPEKLESDLTQIEAILLESFTAGCGTDEVNRIRREGQAQLKKYREGMSTEIYEQTLNNFVAKRIRDTFRLPRLSLFYM